MDLTLEYPDGTTDTVDLYSETPPPQGTIVRVEDHRFVVARAPYLVVKDDRTARYVVELEASKPGGR